MIKKLILFVLVAYAMGACTDQFAISKRNQGTTSVSGDRSVGTFARTAPNQRYMKPTPPLSTGKFINPSKPIK